MCATPIGNLGDAAPRLAEAIESADVVYAEDTRRSRKLLNHLGVSADLRSYFVGNEQRRSVELGERLAAGHTVILLTDAGTPGVADPGLTAVRKAVEAGSIVSVVPGPSAVTAALAVSGMPADRFVFEGFLPRKLGALQQRLRALASESRTLVVFSAARRVAADLTALRAALGADREIVVCRELTKLHEEVFRGSLDDACTRWDEGAAARGEFTLVIAGTVEAAQDVEILLPQVEALVEAGASFSDAIRTVAEDSGVSRRKLYELAITSRDGA